jgi:predicted Holliday junction resolvase-like endonuclease
MLAAIVALATFSAVVTYAIIWLYLHPRVTANPPVATNGEPINDADGSDEKEAAITALKKELDEAKGVAIRIEAELQGQLTEQRHAYEMSKQQIKSDAQMQVQQLKASAQSELQERLRLLDVEYAERKRAENKKSNARSRTALVAKIVEQMAPSLPGFPYNPKEVRHFGEVFDYLVLDGIENDDPESEITLVFLEVKSRSGRRVTNPRERKLRDAIEEGRVEYVLWSPDRNLIKAATEADIE